MATFVPALIAVDIQEDFCAPNGSLAIPQGRDIAPGVNSLLNLPFAIKIATQDWHPSNSKTFASAHPGKKPFVDTYTCANPSDSSSSQTVTWTLWPDHCVAGTPGSSIIPELESIKFDVFVLKGLDPEVEVYSGFGDVFGRRGRHATDVDLGELLKSRGVTDVYVVGLARPACVKYTALDAVKDGYNTYVVWDCTASRTEEASEKARLELEAAGVKIINSDSIEIERIKE